MKKIHGCHASNINQLDKIKVTFVGYKWLKKKAKESADSALGKSNNYIIGRLFRNHKFHCLKENIWHYLLIFKLYYDLIWRNNVCGNEWTRVTPCLFEPPFLDTRILHLFFILVKWPRSSLYFLLFPPPLNALLRIKGTNNVNHVKA